MLRSFTLSRNGRDDGDYSVEENRRTLPGRRRTALGVDEGAGAS